VPTGFDTVLAGSVHRQETEGIQSLALIKETLLRLLRPALLAVIMLAVLATVSLGRAPDANATADHFCGFLYPDQVCINNYQSHWDRVRSRYPGPQAHNVYACVYMWNFATGQQRGGATYCGYTWDSNPIGHNYGVTSQSDYRSMNWLRANNTPHTLVGWTSDNQTDG
jgi:hypothetical protein